jgi:hypothetical protein
MSRFAGALSLVLSTVIAGSAHAQVMQGPPMPIAVDLAKVPVGSWSQYEVIFAGTPPMTSKTALVARGTAGNTFESVLEGGILALARRKVRVSMTVPPGAEKAGRVSRMVMQVDAADPMEMPLDGGQDKQFTRPDPKAMVGKEKVAVRAGSFKTRHYRDKTPTGDTYDYWVADGVLPLGLVELKGNPAMMGGFSFELIAQGKDAKAQITKPTKPFDQAALMQQLTGGLAAPGAAAPAAPGGAAAPAARGGAAPGAAAPAKK